MEIDFEVSNEVAQDYKLELAATTNITDSPTTENIIMNIPNYQVSLKVKSSYYHDHTYIIWLLLSLMIMVVLAGSIMNFEDSKYTKVVGTGTSSSSSTCGFEILSLMNIDSQLCCDDSNEWVCVAFADKTNKWFVSTWSFFLPFIPFLMVATTEFFHALITFKMAESMSVLKKHFTYSSRRFLLYAAIIGVRTVRTKNLSSILSGSI